MSVSWCGAVQCDVYSVNDKVSLVKCKMGDCFYTCLLACSFLGQLQWHVAWLMFMLHRGPDSV